MIEDQNLIRDDAHEALKGNHNVFMAFRNREWIGQCVAVSYGVFLEKSKVDHMITPDEEVKAFELDCDGKTYRWKDWVVDRCRGKGEKPQQLPDKEIDGVDHLM